MKLWFLLICGFRLLTLHLSSLRRISNSLGFSLSVMLCLGSGYCIYAQSGSLVTDKYNTCRCAGPSLKERNRMGLCPLSIHWFSWHLLKLIISMISPFLSSKCDFHQWITNFGRIRKTEKDHIVSISLGKNLWEVSLKSYIR